MTADIVHTIGSSVVQHGHVNNRIYVMHLSREDIPEIIRHLDDLAGKGGYSKIFVKVPESAEEVFAGAGYVTEATVPFFFNGQETARFMAKYADPARTQVADPGTLADVLSVAFGYAQKEFYPVLPAGFSLVHAHPGDAGAIAALFRSVFETYPFPITDPDFIAGSMKKHVRYFCIHKAKRIVAVASCEMNADAGNAEMTDFATDPKFQGHGLAGCLLHAMEREMQGEGIRLAYTIARAASYPINVTFARAGYEYGGMLPNNTNICGALESMNVWYRKL
jgi:putative beta-lysine N-acetyltransferase